MARSRASVSVASVPSANPPEVIDPASTPPASPALATVIPGGTGEALSATPALKDALGTLGASGKLDGLKVPTPAEWRSAVRARVGFELSSKDRKDLGIRDCTAQDTLILSIVQVLDALGADMSAYQYSRTRADGTTSTVNARSINPSLVAKVTRATEMRSIAAAAR